jgi:hypothetical protein
MGQVTQVLTGSQVEGQINMLLDTNGVAQPVNATNPLPVTIAGGSTTNAGAVELLYTDDTGAQFVYSDIGTKGAPNFAAFTVASGVLASYTPGANPRPFAVKDVGVSNFGTGATGVTIVTGGVGVVGWLSSIYKALTSNLAVVLAATATKTVVTLNSAATAVGVSNPFPAGASRRTIQSTVTGTGAVTATVQWFGNNLNSATGGVLISTHLLSGTTTDTAGADIPAEWPFIYASITAVTGTGATVTTTLAS